MGIKGLLIELRPITTRVHISEFKGKRVAIDASCWLHRAAFTCTMQLVLGKPTKAWLSWCTSMIEMLLQYGVTPIFVFDGIALPQKLEENQRRRNQRATARERGLALMQAGNIREASAVFQQAISITPEMQREFIIALRDRHIEYVVAPYEADAQLGFLFQSGDVDVVISEDSDLVLFGVRKLFSKFARDGFGELTDMALLKSPEARKYRFTEALRSLSQEQFLAICIMSGCDYVDGLPGIGLKTALKYALEHVTPERMLRAYRRKHPLPPDYNTKFKRAMLTFQHQRVYDRSSNSICHLSGVQHLEDDGEFLGAALADHIVKDLVIGALNVKTMVTEPFGITEELPELTSEAALAAARPKSQSIGLRVYSDKVDVRRKNRMDFHCDVAMLKDIFGADARSPLFSYNDKHHSGVPCFEESSSQGKTSLSKFSNNSQESMPPIDKSIETEASNKENTKCMSNAPTITNILSNKRQAPPNSRSWVKRIKKPVQHVQRRLTEFFSIKQQT